MFHNSSSNLQRESLLKLKREVIQEQFCFKSLNKIHFQSHVKNYVMCGVGVLVVGRWTLDRQVPGWSNWTGYRHTILGNGINTDFPTRPGEFGYLKPDSERYCHIASI